MRLEAILQAPDPAGGRVYQVHHLFLSELRGRLAEPGLGASLIVVTPDSLNYSSDSCG